MTQQLSAPASYWCPQCQVHLRSKDCYDQSIGHTLMPLCPVCEDKKNRKR